MTAARNYSSTAARAVLTTSASNVDTTLAVDTVSGFPTVPFVLALDKDRVGEEIVLCTAVVGLALTVTRGYDGTSATSHSAGATVQHVAIGKDFQDAADHVGNSSLHWNSATEDLIRLPVQWGRPGITVPGLTTGTPTSVSAGPTTILSGPTTGRRVLKHLLVSGPQAAVFTLTVAGTALYANQLAPTAGNQIYAYQLAIPIANGETIQATVSDGPCVFTPVYGDRADTALDRRGYVASSSSTAANIVASGTARTFTQILIGNTGTVSATAELLVDSTSLTGTLTLPARTLFTIDDPLAITSAQALKYKGDGANSLTYLAVGI